MRPNHCFHAAVLAALLLAPPAALATSPGVTDERFQSAVDHYCANDPTIRCQTTTGEPPLFDGSECGVPNPVCEPDVIDGAEIRVMATIMGHDQGKQVCVEDNAIECVQVTPLGNPGYTGEECPQPAPSPPCKFENADNDDAPRVISILMEFEINGNQYVVHESYPPHPGGFTQVGTWTNPIPDEAIDSFESFLTIPGFTQRDIQIRLRAIAKAEFGEDGIPFIAEDFRKTPLLEVDETDTSLGSVRRYRVLVKFGRGTPPN